MKKSAGNIGDLLTTGICILAMTVVMSAYLNCTQMIHQKAEISQLARKYILRMEAVGYLTHSDEMSLCRELEDMGVTEIDLEGTNRNEVSYGMAISLQIKGKMRGEYVFREQRVSTAKN